MGGHEKGARGAVHTKAAEAGPLVSWICVLLRDYAVLGGKYLSQAGDALKRHMKINKEAPAQLTQDACDELLYTFHRHMRLLKEGGVRTIPKHHLWCHLTLMAGKWGNPRAYSCFLDETMNGVVSTIAQHSHQAAFERNVFIRLQLLPLFSRFEKYFANV